MRFADPRYLNVLLAVSLLWPALVFGAPLKTYGDIHNARYVAARDGRTVVMSIAGVHPLLGERIAVRIRGIAVPEITGRCDRERDLARQARDIVGWFLQRAGKITLKDVSRDRLFRINAIVLADGRDVREVLVKKGVAVWNSAPGGTKDWCK